MDLRAGLHRRSIIDGPTHAFSANQCWHHPRKKTIHAMRMMTKLDSCYPGFFDLAAHKG